MNQAGDPGLEEEGMEFPDVPLLFGRFLVLGGILGESDIAEAIMVQRDLNATAMFVLVEQGFYSLEEILSVRACQHEAMVGFKEASRRLGLPANADLDEAIELARGQHVRLGEVLVRQGKITREVLASALEWHRTHQEGSGLFSQEEDSTPGDPRVRDEALSK